MELIVYFYEVFISTLNMSIKNLKIFVYQLRLRLAASSWLRLSRSNSVGIKSQVLGTLWYTKFFRVFLDTKRIQMDSTHRGEFCYKFFLSLERRGHSSIFHFFSKNYKKYGWVFSLYHIPTNFSAPSAESYLQQPRPKRDINWKNFI